MKFLFITLVFLVSLLNSYEGESTGYNPYAFTDENILNDDNSTFEEGYIDKYQKEMSGKVHEWGVDIDGVLLETYNFIGGDDSDLNETKRTDANLSVADVNVSSLSQEHNLSKKLKSYAAIESEKVDELFLSRRLLETRDRSYVRVSLIKQMNSLDSNPSTFRVRARLGLGRSKKRLKLFIEDFNEDSAKNIGKTDAEDSPSIGLEKKSKKIFGVRPRYSVGFRGIDPFVRARYNYETDLGRWHFEPVQTFIYSLEDEFSERTEFYLDTPTSERTLLRFVVDRGTESRHGGMNYDGFVQWFWTLRKHRGLSFNLGFNGHTKYEQDIEETDPLEYENKNKVYNYLFLMRWRENIFRKWFFYEVGTGVNYHQVHDYRPNYNIYFGIDLFFGHV